MSEVTCSIEGCNKPTISRGWCSAHYYRWLRHGDPLKMRGRGAPGVRRKPIRLAVCQNCGKTFEVPYGSHGKFCNRACFIRLVAKACPWCDKRFTIRQSKAARYRYCSMQCKRAAARAARITYECKVCGNLISRGPWEPPAKFCSYECAGLSSPSGYLAWKIQTGYRTDIEALVEAVLIELDVSYLFEHQIGRYFIDFALPDHKIALECDGWTHRQQKAKDYDQRRDLTLGTAGWRVVRLTDRVIQADTRLAVVTALDRFHGIESGA